MSPRGTKLVTILKTSNKHIVKVAKSLLDDAQFEFYIKCDGEGIKSSENLVQFINLTKGPFELQVSKDNEIKAKSLLADLEELDFEEKDL